MSIVNYRDEVVTRLRYENCDQKHFEAVPSYIKELRNGYAARHVALISIESEDPENLKNIDPLKYKLGVKLSDRLVSLFMMHWDLGINRWCIVGAPSVGWANKVFPEMSDSEAVEALWKAIFKVTRCDQENPIEAWEEHRRSFERRVQILNEKKIKSLHYFNSLGTDLNNRNESGLCFLLVEEAIQRMVFILSLISLLKKFLRHQIFIMSMVSFIVHYLYTIKDILLMNFL